MSDHHARRDNDAHHGSRRFGGPGPEGAHAYPPAGGEPVGTRASEALHRLAVDENDSAALGALVTADILVPDLSDPGRDNGDARVVKLPVAEQPDGRQFVPTFTTERRLADALPEVDHYRQFSLGALVRMWPSDDLMLAVDPGSAEGITFPAEGVRALAALAD